MKRGANPAAAAVAIGMGARSKPARPVPSPAQNKKMGRPEDLQNPDESEEPDYEHLEEDELKLHWWRRTHGLETVSGFVRDYKNHPGGWTALLLIHGIPEVTGRLRSKVEGCAIYGALFLAASLAGLISPPDHVAYTCEDEYSGDWTCAILKRVYTYSLMVGGVSHLFVIALSLAFGNALNEAARDADVFRMFARGGGFKATVKCEYAFYFGIVMLFNSVMVVYYTILGVEGLVSGSLSMAVFLLILKRTAGPLMDSGSIHAYWRGDYGAGHDAGDEYDLSVPVEGFDHLVQKCHDKLILENEARNLRSKEAKSSEAAGTPPFISLKPPAPSAWKASDSGPMHFGTPGMANQILTPRDSSRPRDIRVATTEAVEVPRGKSQYAKGKKKTMS